MYARNERTENSRSCTQPILGIQLEALRSALDVTNRDRDRWHTQAEELLRKERDGRLLAGIERLIARMRRTA